MSELIDIFLIGYFDAFDDAKLNNILKKFKVDLSNDIKSKIYDMGYSNGYLDCFTYLKK